MLHYIYGTDLHHYPKLRDGMFRDRTAQFHVRMGWDVNVDKNGFERDEYDDMNPLYVIFSENGNHAGSLRLLPTTGRTMVNDHFKHLAGQAIVSPFIWECTRFCLAPGSHPRVAASLMLAGGEVLQGFDIRNFVGVFDAPMVRIYRLIGAEPEVLGTDDGISAGLWTFTKESQAKISHRAQVSAAQSRAWFDESFNAKVLVPA